MPTLLMCMVGPMQAWGTTSRFDERDTQLEPSKSAVIGLVCAALGRDRSEPVRDLAALRMGVRVDHEGVPMRDYQTATGVVTAAGQVQKNRTVVSPRYYLADAAFLVGLEGEDKALLQQIEAALRSPHWPLALGRKSCVPSVPIGLPGGLLDQPLLQALQSWPRLPEPRAKADVLYRFVLEDEAEGSVRLDQPIGPFSERRFGPRYVKTFQESIHVPDTATA